MKTNIYLFALIFAITACSVGVNKDLMTGLKVSNTGLSYEDSYLVVDNAKLTSNEVEMQSTVYLYVEGAEGFVEDEGKVYVGCKMLVLDMNNDTLYASDDLFEAYDADGFLAQTISEGLNANLTIGAPLGSGQTYAWKVKFWDKSGSGVINAEAELRVK